MTPETTILFAIAAPLVAVPLLAMTGTRANLREGVTLTTATVTFLAVASLFDDVFVGVRPSVVLGEMIPGLSSPLRLSRLVCCSRASPVFFGL